MGGSKGHQQPILSLPTGGALGGFVLPFNDSLEWYGGPGAPYPCVLGPGKAPTYLGPIFNGPLRDATVLVAPQHRRVVTPASAHLVHLGQT